MGPRGSATTGAPIAGAVESALADTGCEGVAADEAAASAFAKAAAAVGALDGDGAATGADGAAGDVEGAEALSVVPDSKRVPAHSDLYRTVSLDGSAYLTAVPLLAQQKVPDGHTWNK
jgi:hypothetical protein